VDVEPKESYRYGHGHRHVASTGKADDDYYFVYAEESLLLIRGLGLQTSTSSPSYLSTPTTRFIPMSQIQDIFIHEAFKGFEVKFYLAVIVVGEEETVVVFPKLLPKREILEEVWRGAKTVLYQNKIY